MLVAFAALLWSTAGVYVRLLPYDVWTLLTWRSGFAGLSLSLFFLVRHGRGAVAAIRAIGRPGLVAIPLATISMSCFVVALAFTTVANVMVIYATVPFVAAAIAWLWTGERATPRTLLASAIALVGVLVMAAAPAGARDMAGNALALLMTVAFGAQLVMARRYPGLDMMPVNAIAALVCTLVYWPLSNMMLPPPADLALLAVFGVTTTAMAYMLFLIGGRHIPSGEAGLVGLLDVVLGPVWVWLLFDERPARSALLGGGIVLVAAVFYLGGELRQLRARLR